jgi:HAMP domain-containing protein
MVQFLRRNRLPKPRLQLRLVLGFAGVSTLALSVQVLLLAQRLVNLAQDLPLGGAELRETLPILLFDVAGFSLLVLLPAVLGIGVLMTFKLAGPIYRFERYFDDVAAGRDTGPCKIRSGDELQELCQKINAAMAARAAAPQQAAEATALTPSLKPEERRAAA